MTNRIKILSVATMLLVALICISLLLQDTAFQGKEVFAAEQAEQSQNQNLIQVSGQGEIYVDPDVAYVSFGIQTKADTAAKAQADNAAAFAQLEKVLYTDYQLKKTDVQTTQFRIQPQYVYNEKDGQKITGYSAVHIVQLTYRDLSNLGELLDAASKAGVNEVSNIQFDTEKADQYELEAIKKAMSNAKGKAEVIAQSANRTVKGIVNVAQSSSGIPSPIYSGREMAKVMADSAASTSISTGQVKVTATVSVQYEF